mmetsp:Transcript_17209/g.60481  ORF Transcript_17209/g.60481 Transcript_17209/m.60481 type:complete len:582 (-) Transcript_17209:155-1900(-)
MAAAGGAGGPAGVPIEARLDALPFEIILEVLAFVSPGEWNSLASSCRGLHALLSRSSLLWRPPPGRSVAQHKAAMRDALLVRLSLARGDSQSTLLRGHGNRVLDVRLSAAGDEVYSSSADGTARVWRLRRRNGVVLAGHRGWVTRVERVDDPAVDAADGDAGPSSFLLATTSVDKTVRLWRVHDRAGREAEEVATMRGHRAAVTTLAVAGGGARGPLLLTGSSDGTVRVWSVRGRRALHVLHGHAAGAVEGVRHNDVEGTGRAELAATRCGDNVVRVYALEDGELFATCVLPEECASLAWVAPRRLMVAYGRCMALWDMTEVDAGADDSGGEGDGGVAAADDDGDAKGGDDGDDGDASTVATVATAGAGARAAGGGEGELEGRDGGVPDASVGSILHVWRAADADASLRNVRLAGTSRDRVVVVCNVGDVGTVFTTALAPPYRRLRRLARAEQRITRASLSDDGGLVLVADRSGTLSVFALQPAPSVPAALRQGAGRRRRVRRRRGAADDARDETGGGGSDALVVLRGVGECRRLAWNGRAVVGAAEGDCLRVINFAASGRVDGFTGMQRRKTTEAWKVVG